MKSQMALAFCAAAACMQAAPCGVKVVYMDMAPPAVMQGANRIERFRNFEKYLDKFPEWKKQVSFHVFEGVGHKEDLCYPDPAVLDFVFGADGRQAE